MANEKRLIDANAINEKCRATKLTEVFPEWKQLPISAQKAVCRLGNYFKNIVQEAPTVYARPVVHGRWEDGCAIRNCKEVYKSIDCSVCEEVFKIESHDREYWKNRFKNCPFCGAKMDGGNEDGNL